MTDYKSRAKEIGRRIREERKRLKLLPDVLLNEISMSPSSTKTLRSWENGERIPDLDSLARMAEIFDCDMGYLLCDYETRRLQSGDVTIKLNRSDAETVCSLLGDMNFYHVGTVVAMKNEYDDDDVQQAALAVGRVFRALYRALGRK